MSLDRYLEECPAPADLSAELIEKYSFHAQYYGDEQAKKDAASAKRTATHLDKAARQFAQLTTADHKSLLQAASAMRTLAANLARLARWAARFKVHCEQARKADLVLELAELAKCRWTSSEEQDFEIALVEEMRSREGMATYARWQYGHGRFTDIAEEDFLFDWSTSTADRLGLQDQPPGIRHLACLTQNDMFASGGASTTGKYFHVARPEFEKYLAYRKEVAQLASAMLNFPREGV